MGVQRRERPRGGGVDPFRGVEGEPPRPRTPRTGTSCFPSRCHHPPVEARARPPPSDFGTPARCSGSRSAPPAVVPSPPFLLPPGSSSSAGAGRAGDDGVAAPFGTAAGDSEGGEGCGLDGGGEGWARIMEVGGEDGARGDCAPHERRQWLHRLLILFFRSFRSIDLVVVGEGGPGGKQRVHIRGAGQPDVRIIPAAAPPPPRKRRGSPPRTARRHPSPTSDDACYCLPFGAVSFRLRLRPRCGIRARVDCDRPRSHNDCAHAIDSVAASSRRFDGNAAPQKRNCGGPSDVGRRAGAG